jgi:hypothetical protein
MSNPLPPKKENVEPLHNGAGFVDLSGQSGNSTVLAELIDNGIKLTVRGYALGIGNAVLAVTGDRLLVERRKRPRPPALRASRAAHTPPAS